MKTSPMLGLVMGCVAVFCLALYASIEVVQYGKALYYRYIWNPTFIPGATFWMRPYKDGILQWKSGDYLFQKVEIGKEVKAYGLFNRELEDEELKRLNEYLQRMDIDDTVNSRR